MKRFIRDHVRYRDEIQCAAARIVQAVRARSKANGNVDGEYDAFRIRRGDFQSQYKDMKLSAEEIYFNNTRNVIQDGRTVYVATDEKNRDFFVPLAEHYKLLYQSDFQDLIADVNPNQYGMLEQ